MQPPRDLLIKLGCHASAIVLYALLWGWSFSLYRHWGGTVTRGVDIGMAAYLIFYAVAAVNLMAVAVPGRAVRYVLAAGLGLLILAWLLPDYPLRAPLFACLATGTTSVAVVASGWLSASGGVRRSRSG